MLLDMRREIDSRKLREHHTAQFGDDIQRPTERPPLVRRRENTIDLSKQAEYSRDCHRNTLTNSNGSELHGTFKWAKRKVIAVRTRDHGRLRI